MIKDEVSFSWVGSISLTFPLSFQLVVVLYSRRIRITVNFSFCVSISWTCVHCSTLIHSLCLHKSEYTSCLVTDLYKFCILSNVRLFIFSRMPNSFCFGKNLEKVS